MADKPIVFSGWKVRAIYAGADVTRRLMNPQPPENSGFLGNNYLGDWCWSPLSLGAHNEWRSPRFHRGDLLWVREAWFPDPPIDGWAGDITWNGCGRPIDGVPQKYRLPEHVIYRATWEGAELIWRPSIHMPKWACRLWVVVTEEPTPERVRDITEAEAIREGVERFAGKHGVQGWKPYREGNLDVLQFAANSYHTMWDSIHGPDSWERDWVWRIAIERTEAPHA